MRAASAARMVMTAERCGVFAVRQVRTALQYIIVGVCFSRLPAVAPMMPVVPSGVPRRRAPMRSPVAWASFSFSTESVTVVSRCCRAAAVTARSISQGTKKTYRTRVCSVEVPG